MRKKIVALFAAFLLLLTSTACHMVYKNQEKDYAQVVFSVNGKEYTKGDIMHLYEAYRNSYGLTDENQETLPISITTIKCSTRSILSSWSTSSSPNTAAEIGITGLTSEEQKRAFRATWTRWKKCSKTPSAPKWRTRRRATRQ